MRQQQPSEVSPNCRASIWMSTSLILIVAPYLTLRRWARVHQGHDGRGALARTQTAGEEPIDSAQGNRTNLVFRKRSIFPVLAGDHGMCLPPGGDQLPAGPRFQGSRAS